MNKSIKFLAVAAASVMSLGFTACSDDDDDDAPRTDVAVIENNIPKVFPNGRPVQIGQKHLYYDEKGKLIRVEDEYSTYTFDYSGSKEYEVVMTSRWHSDNDVTRTYFDLNENGFATRVYQEIHEDGGIYQVNVNVQYNSDNQVKALSFTYPGGGRTSTIDYRDGNIVTVTNKETGEPTETSTYTYTEYENKGNFALFDDMYDIDIEEVEYAFFAGILGRAPKYLLDASNDGDYTYSYTWTIDENGLSTSYKGEYDYEPRVIVWE